MKTLFRIFFLLAISTLSISLQAQGWQESYGGTENDSGSKAVELANGDFWVSTASYVISPSDGSTPLLKINSSGALLSYDTLIGKTISDMKKLQNGDIMIYGTKTDEEFDRPFLTRFDESGNELWTQVYQDTFDNGSPQSYYYMAFAFDFLELSNGDISFRAFYAATTGGDNGRNYIFKAAENGDLYSDQDWEIYGESFSISDPKLLSNGNFIYEYYFPQNGNGGITVVDSSWNQLPTFNFPDADGNYAATLDGGFIICDNTDKKCYTYDEIGNLLDEYPYISASSFITKILRLQDNSFLCAGFDNDEINNPGKYDFFIQKIFPSSGSGWQSRKYYKPLTQFAGELIATTDGGYLLAGRTESALTNDDVFLTKVDTNGLLGGHLLTGTIRHDVDQNCNLDIAEEGLSGFVVIAESNQTNYSITNEFGEYEIELSPGYYDVKAIPKNDLWYSCSDSLDALFINLNDTTTIDFDMQSIVDCPLLEVNIATPFLRRCFENTYVVSYCNNGTLLSENTSIEVILDPAMEVISTSIPIVSSLDSLYIFDIGDLEFSECGSFTIDVLLDPDCDETEFQETHCVSAHILPDTACIINDLWSGADIELAADCGADSLSFFIQNVGSGDMNQFQNFVIIEDEVIRHEGIFQLDAGQIQTEKVPANGATYRMEAEQVPFHPFTKVVSITVEGCGLNAANEISLGFVNVFPEADEAPFLSIDCQQNIGSFDPNDKQGFPLGYGDENYINQNVAIDYMIRFQNTGTDTAFTVVIVDTLSTHLNPASLTPGPSSHEYQYTLTENGIATFTFENILLPDSNVNEVLSNGFVKFKIEQFPNNPIGTDIYNSAAIYFDFNEPVITNTTQHQIGERLLATIIVDLPNSRTNNVLVYPNPFKEQTTFELEGPLLHDLTLVIYNSLGYNSIENK